MTAAMLGDLFMLPNLLMLFDQRPENGPETSVPEAHIGHSQKPPATVT